MPIFDMHSQSQLNSFNFFRSIFSFEKNVRPFDGFGYPSDRTIRPNSSTVRPVDECRHPAGRTGRPFEKFVRPVDRRGEAA
jgi:hypothetical protein